MSRSILDAADLERSRRKDGGTQHTPGPYSVVNGKVMLDGATARYEVPPIEARDRINELLAALRVALIEMRSMNNSLRKHGEGRPDDGAHPDCAIEIARAAIARAQGAS